MPTTILIVEDHDLLRQALRTWLEIAFPKCHIIEATKEAQAIALAQSSRPHVIVMDVSLSGTNGFEAVGRIKAVVPATPVVLLTNNKDETYRICATASGASAYVRKKAIQTELQPTLAALLAPPK
jgi:DNA-binding NarL/FixJ family response regulator